MSNILRDFLPDSPREANILIAASEADVAGQLRAYHGRGMDAGTAQGIVTSDLAERTALHPDACRWVVHEIAVSLGVSPRDIVPSDPSQPAVADAPRQYVPTAQLSQPTHLDQPAYPGQPTYPAQPTFHGQPAYPGQQAFPGQQGYAGYPGYPGQAPIPPQTSKRKTIIGIAAAATAVVVIAVAFAVIGHSPGTPSHPGVIGEVTNVPVSTLNAVGAGRSFPDNVRSISGRGALTSGGKPEFLYIGATFCPYCAANQWAVIVALSRFGTFSGLADSRSAPRPEIDPNTATLSFDKASYSSQYLTFVTVDSETVNRAPLQPATPQETTLWDAYTSGSWPFLDFGNRYYTQELFDPAILQGKTQKQIAAALSDPSSPIAQAIDGSANLVTAAVCSITGNQPQSVCGAADITSLEDGL